jgi:hypothetical protein
MLSNVHTHQQEIKFLQSWFDFWKKSPVFLVFLQKNRQKEQKFQKCIFSDY